MGVYYVDKSTGKAPSGLVANDYVLTNGGTYQIKSVKPDGSYDSSLVDRNITASNYANQYGAVSTTGGVNGAAASGISNTQKTAQDITVGSAAERTTPAAVNAGSGATVTHYGQGTLTMDASGRITRDMGNGNAFFVDPGDEKYNSIYAEYLARNTATPKRVSYSPDTSNDTAINAQMQQLQSYIDQLANQQYTPISQDEYKADIMSYDEAYALAKQIVEPQYNSLYQQTATQAAENLERAGLHDSLYGQQLAAAAKNQVNQDMNAAIAQQALSLMDMSRQDALNWYQAAVNENQYGASYQQNAISTAASATNSLISNLLQQSRDRNDAALQAASLELQAQAQAIDAQLAASTISVNQAEIAYRNIQSQALQLEIQLAQQENQGSAVVRQVSNGSSSYYNNDDYTVGSAGQTENKELPDRQAVSESKFNQLKSKGEEPYVLFDTYGQYRRAVDAASGIDTTQKAYGSWSF